MRTTSSQLRVLFENLFRHYGFPAGWPAGDWPRSGAFQPPEFEIVVGALLTQNTRWRNVEKALLRLVGSGLVSAPAVASVPLTELQQKIQGCGYYRQKARRLQGISGFISNFSGDFYRRIDRRSLLALEGIGPETADAILLYACDRLHFVVDAYTRRIFTRYGTFPRSVGYADMQQFFQRRLPPEVALYKGFHALIVEHAQQTCRQQPLCEPCVLRTRCRWTIEGKVRNGGGDVGCWTE